MSRVLDIGASEAGTTLRQQLMAHDHLQLVAMLEDATAREIAATRLCERALGRLQDAYEIGKGLQAQHEAEMESVIFTIYEECSGGQQTSTHILVTLLTNAFSGIIAETGGRRTVLAKFMTKLAADSFNTLDGMPSDDWADPIAEQFYLLAALGQVSPAMGGIIVYGTLAEDWYLKGQKVYLSRATPLD